MINDEVMSFNDLHKFLVEKGRINGRVVLDVNNRNIQKLMVEVTDPNKNPLLRKC